MGDAGVNLPSCNEAAHAVDGYITAELAAGRIAGPFPPEFPWIIKISPDRHHLREILRHISYYSPPFIPHSVTLLTISYPVNAPG